MMTIWETILNELETRSWSRYRLVQEIKGKIPERTVYAYLSGDCDITSDKVSIILEALELEIRPRIRRKRKETSE
jgi:hypothetical protein